VLSTYNLAHYASKVLIPSIAVLTVFSLWSLSFGGVLGVIHVSNSTIFICNHWMTSFILATWYLNGISTSIDTSRISLQAFSNDCFTCSFFYAFASLSCSNLL
jgi:hypothetical protein